MPKFLDPLVANAPYFFIAVGVVWLAIAAATGSALILWPVIACIAAGIMLRQIPSHRFTWAWVISSAVLGFVISLYLVYTWVGYLGGAFSSLAAESLAAFAVLAVVHVFLFFAGSAKPPTAEAPK